MIRSIVIFVFITGWISACDLQPKNNTSASADTLAHTDSLQAKSGSATAVKDTLEKDSIHTPDTRADTVSQSTTILLPTQTINTRQVRPDELVSFAETLMGTPYVYASTNPKVGFDCSGFITHVFNHFGISVPRSSIDFTNVGKEIPVTSAKRGDIVLFTGTNPAERSVGHMGIVVSNSDTLRFIHSTSGKAMGVTITPLNPYYQKRFVKTIRVFPEPGKTG